MNIQTVKLEKIKFIRSKYKDIIEILSKPNCEKAVQINEAKTTKSARLLRNTVVAALIRANIKVKTKIIYNKIFIWRA